MTHTITLTPEQLGELHVTLGLRLDDVRSTLNSPHQLIAEVSRRQLDRIQPLFEMIEQKVMEAYK